MCRLKTYIIHVSTASERKKRIDRELKNKQLNPILVTEGDKNQLTDSAINKYFKGMMASVSNATSCAYKHILAYEKIVKGKDDLVLVLEDDIRFYSNYSKIYDIIDEIKMRKLENFLISVEDSTLKYVPRSKRIKGTWIYPQQIGRTTGAYMLDKKCANSLLKYITDNKTDLPIDWFHNKVAHNNKISIYWTQPAIAVQGSLDGSVKSIIDEKKWGSFRECSFKIQRLYKKLLYWAR